MKNPIAHQFVVFSVIDDTGEVKSKFSQCNNCGIIHRVFDIGKSEVLKNKEHMNSIVTIEEIKSSLSENLVAVLETNDADRASWEFAKFIVDTKDWGAMIILSREQEGDQIIVKYVRIISETLINVDQEILDAYVKKG